MRVLVTGATGFVASHLIPSLATEHEVFGLGHDESRIATGCVRVVRDLRAADATEDLPHVDAVVHLAQANVPFPDGAVDLVSVNTASTVRLLDWSRRHAVARFVYASSASVYGAADGRWSEADDPAAPDFYARTKLAGEHFVVSYQEYLATAIFRLVAPYGPEQRNRMIPRLIQSVREGRPIRLNEGGRPRMNPIYVDDVVAAVDGVLHSRENLLLNVGGNDVVSVADIAGAAGRAIGRDPIFEPSGSTSGDIVCDNGRLRALLAGRELVSIDDGIRRTAKLD